MNPPFWIPLTSRIRLQESVCSDALLLALFVCDYYVLEELLRCVSSGRLNYSTDNGQTISWDSNARLDSHSTGMAGAQPSHTPTSKDKLAS